ncbi:MAG: phage tail protein [Saprospiraceae bacterium]|nr:phage tail protein [Saprospiraceae bacterium]
MADYPLPKFHFQVFWNDKIISFSEVSGLSQEVEPIEYRHGDSMEYHKIKLPGLRKYGNVTLKRGTFKSRNDFYEWWSKTINYQEGNNIGSQYRTTVQVMLLDEEGKPIVKWKLTNAFPIKVQPTDFKADGNEVAIETLEIVHEKLETEYL